MKMCTDWIYERERGRRKSELKRLICVQVFDATATIIVARVAQLLKIRTRLGRIRFFLSQLFFYMLFQLLRGAHSERMRHQTKKRTKQMRKRGANELIRFCNYGTTTFYKFTYRRSFHTWWYSLRSDVCESRKKNNFFPWFWCVCS